MSTALSIRKTGVQPFDRPSHESSPVQEHAALPRPPKICEKLNNSVPALFSGQERIKHLGKELGRCNGRSADDHAITP